MNRQDARRQLSFHPPIPGLFANWNLAKAGWDRAPDDSGSPLILALAGSSMLDPGHHEVFPPHRVFAMAVDSASRREDLLRGGYAEALPRSATLGEVAIRAERWRSRSLSLPRVRRVGALQLDLLHRDARRDDRWLGLFPQEFNLMWRLTDDPGTALAQRVLLADLWRDRANPETNTLAVHVARLRAKLALAGFDGAVETMADGSYRLVLQSIMALSDQAPGAPPGPMGMTDGANA